MNITTKQAALLENVQTAWNQGRLYAPANSSESKTLSILVAHDFLTRPLRGLYAPRGAWDDRSLSPRKRLRIKANGYAAAHPNAIFCAYTAAALHGLWVSQARYRELDIISQTMTGKQAANPIVRWPARNFAEYTDRDPARTQIIPTLAMCMLDAPLPESLALVDSALHFKLTTKEEIGRFLATSCHGSRGIKRAFDSLRLADERPDNGGESVVRGMIAEAGYMPPTQLQADFPDPIDGSTHRVDMFWITPTGGVIGEVDGMEKYSSNEDRSTHVLVQERQRESHLTSLGYPVMRILYSRVNEPDYLPKLLQSFHIPRLTNPSCHKRQQQ